MAFDGAFPTTEEVVQKCERSGGSLGLDGRQYGRRKTNGKQSTGERQRGAARIMPLHLSPEEAGAVFAKVQPKLAVYSHSATFGVSDDELVSRTRKTYPGPLVVGADLPSFDITDVVAIKKWLPK